LPVDLACRVLEVSTSGFYAWRSRPSSPTALRRAWLTGVIREIHARSRGTYGSPRVRAELRLGMGIMVSRKTVAKLMRAAGLAGIPRRQTRRNPKYVRSTACPRLFASSSRGRGGVPGVEETEHGRPRPARRRS
jgi:hypothetical protein